MPERRALLAMLQHGDSFFPSGAVSFSWGIEALGADGKISKADDVARFVRQQLKGRWATSDRPVLCAAHAAGGDLDSVLTADRLMEANSLAAEQREGSKRMGAALLNIHARLETRGAKDYQARLRAGAAPGHVAAVQGFLWHALGLDVVLQPTNGARAVRSDGYEDRGRDAVLFEQLCHLPGGLIHARRVCGTHERIMPACGRADFAVRLQLPEKL